MGFPKKDLSKMHVKYIETVKIEDFELRSGYIKDNFQFNYVLRFPIIHFMFLMFAVCVVLCRTYKLSAKPKEYNELWQ